MGERRITADGRILEKQADGSIIEVGGGTPQGNIYTMPMTPQQQAKNAAELSNSQAGLYGKTLDNDITRATMGDVVRKSAADADKARSDADKARSDAAVSAANAAAQPNPATTRASRDLGLDEVLTAIKNARANTSGWSTGMGGQFFGNFGGTQAVDLSGDLSTIGSALTVDKLKEMKAQSATGASGMGALSEREGALLRDSVASLNQLQSPDKVRQSLDAIELHYRRLRAIQDGQDPDNAAVQKQYGIVGGFDAIGGNDGGPKTIASGPTRKEHSARLSAKIDSMMNAGATLEQINAAMREAKYPPVNSAQYAAARKWMAENPGKRYSGGDANRDVPMSLLERAAGSTGGAFVANFANDMTAGSAAALAGERGRGALDAMSQVSPNASMAGSILGGLAGAGGAELAAARLLPAAFASRAARAGDAIYGGTQGFNGAQDGDGLKGMALGAGAGVVGGALGDPAGRYIGGAIKGVTNPMVRAMRDSGVPMTIGQALSQSGTVGRTVKGIEDALTSVPGVGNVIDARRTEGIEQFNRQAFRQAGDPIGYVSDKVGQAGIDQLNNAKAQAYTNALGGTSINAADPAFQRAVGDAVSSARAIPNVNDAQTAAIEALRSRIGGSVMPGDVIPGRNFQEAYRGLARTARERQNGDYGHEIGQVMREGQDALASALETQNPGAFQAFANANQANRRLSVLADAVNAAKNQNEMLFTPAQLNAADANSATKLTSRIRSMAGDRPFAQYAQAAQAILPSKLPDSGTFKRLAVGSVLTGGAAGTGAVAGAQDGEAAKGGLTGGGMGILAALALMGGGTKAAQKAATKMLLDRPDAIRRIGQSIQDNSAYFAPVGAGLSGPFITNLLAGN